MSKKYCKFAFMEKDKQIYQSIHRPTYVLDETKLRNNLSLIKTVAETANVEVILALKAYALWKTFPIFRE